MKCLWFPHLHKNAVNHFSLDFLRTVLWSCFIIAFFIFWMICTQLKWFLILQKRINLIMKFWELSLLTVHVNSYRYVHVCQFFLDPSLTPFDIINHLFEFQRCLSIIKETINWFFFKHLYDKWFFVNFKNFLKNV